MQEWRTVFWVTFIIYLVGMLLFCLLMSAEQQPWDGGNSNTKDGDDQEISLSEDS